MSFRVRPHHLVCFMVGLTERDIWEKDQKTCNNAAFRVMLKGNLPTCLIPRSIEPLLYSAILLGNTISSTTPLSRITPFPHPHMGACLVGIKLGHYRSLCATGTLGQENRLNSVPWHSKGSSCALLGSLELQR